MPRPRSRLYHCNDLLTRLPDCSLALLSSIVCTTVGVMFLKPRCHHCIPPLFNSIPLHSFLSPTRRHPEAMTWHFEPPNMVWPMGSSISSLLPLPLRFLSQPHQLLWSLHTLHAVSHLRVFAHVPSLPTFYFCPSFPWLHEPIHLWSKLVRTGIPSPAAQEFFVLPSHLVHVPGTALLHCFVLEFNFSTSPVRSSSTRTYSCSSLHPCVPHQVWQRVSF